ncbi:DUF302 domain-containing protein [Psychrobacter sp. 1U2]|uniref:DUF302 domain-containing protein n=1 Tax=Psychrobacter sp. 1U2 TaxID=3453577 RepID=UPI003F44C888
MLKIIPIAALALLATSCASVENILPNNTEHATTMTTPATHAKKGLITLQSQHSVSDTANKLTKVIENKGMTVFAQVDHQKNAAGVNLSLRPTQVVMFGNPKAGTPLMNCEQSIAIDLPQKVLITEDAQQRVWLSYNDPQYLKNRHNLQGCDKELANIAKALNGISQAAIAK